MVWQWFFFGVYMYMLEANYSVHPQIIRNKCIHQQKESTLSYSLCLNGESHLRMVHPVFPFVLMSHDSVHPFEDQPSEEVATSSPRKSRLVIILYWQFFQLFHIYCFCSHVYTFMTSLFVFWSNARQVVFSEQSRQEGLDPPVVTSRPKKCFPKTPMVGQLIKLHENCSGQFLNPKKQTLVGGIPIPLKPLAEHAESTW